jgi:hypothetical protein
MSAVGWAGQARSSRRFVLLFGAACEGCPGHPLPIQACCIGVYCACGRGDNICRQSQCASVWGVRMQTRYLEAVHASLGVPLQLVRAEFTVQGHWTVHALLFLLIHLSTCRQQQQCVYSSILFHCEPCMEKLQS